METPKRRWQKHRINAKTRGVPFRLTFEEWLKIWEDSGHLGESGSYRGQYHMARFGDKGAYEVGNVRIITAEANHREINFSETSRVKMSISQRGRKHSEATKEKIRQSKLGTRNPNFGKKASIETRAKQSRARMGNTNSLGYKHSEETRTKIKNALLGNQYARKNRKEEVLL
jgi:hypothetical protein